jgi:hypothetical protein
MAINKATIYERLLDSVVQAGLTSTPLTAKQSMIQYSGGDTVKIAKLTATGFGTYSRTAGYPTGTASLDWGTYTIPYDRGVSFLIDVMDQDETAGMLSSGNLIAEFGNAHEVPEVDSARYMAIFQAIVDDTTVVYGYYLPVIATILTQFNSDVSAIRAKCGRTPQLIAFMGESAFGILSNSTQLSKEMMVQSVAGDNGVTTDIYKINGVQIIPVPDDRLLTEYAFSATNGYSAKAWAQQMNWVICSPDAVVAFEKHRKVKVFSADTVQGKDGDLIETRLYHGCWVLDNKHNMIYVSLKTATIAGFSAAELLTPDATHVTYTIATYATRDTGHKFYYLTTGTVAATTAPAAYDDMTLTSYTEITDAAAHNVAVTSGYYGALLEIDENGRAVRFETQQAHI